jgi:endonuclease YncB( thermonuclease family)
MGSFGPYPAVVTGVHDGDTLTVDVHLKALKERRVDHDLGFAVHIRAGGVWLVGQRVRLAGINAPELHTVAGIAAHAYLESLVDEGEPVALTSLGWDKYGGRIDGVIVLANGRSLADLMVDANQAARWDGKGPKPVPGG